MAAFKCKEREEGTGTLEGQSPAKRLETASILPYFKLQDISKAGGELELPKVCRGITLDGETLSPKESIIRTPSASKMLVSTLKLTVGLQWPSNQCLQVAGDDGCCSPRVPDSQLKRASRRREGGREGGRKRGREEERREEEREEKREGRKEGRKEGKERREGGKEGRKEKR
ncbi:Octapeptide-repeat protein T2, partial [Ophiophagus hannah]